MKPATLILAALALLFGAARARADIIADSVNASGHSYASWSASDVGWYYTPTTSYTLSAVQTQFGSSDGRTVTGVVYDTNTPSDGGSLLRTTTLVPVANDFAGGVFTPLSLSAGHTYFVGFENVSGLATNVTADAGAISLGSLRYDFNNPAPPGTFDSTESNDFTGQPMLRFLAPVPEPSSIALLGTATASIAGYFGWRRRKQPATA